MDNLIVLSWVAYFISAALLLLASWKLLFRLPFTLKAGIFLSQLAILLVPTTVSNTAKAPTFIVLVIDLLSRSPANEIITKVAPLVATLILAWPLALVWGWLRAKHLSLAAKKAAENSASETN